MDGRSTAGGLVRRATLLCALSTLASSCNAILGPSSPDSNWRAADRGHFTFYVRPNSFAEQHLDELSTVLEDQYAYTVAVLSVGYTGHISLFLYNSASDADLRSNRSGTAYPETEAVKAVCTGPLDADLLMLLAHETNHVIARDGIGRAGTSLVNEGIASAVLSERYHQLGRHYLYSWTRMNAQSLPSLASLSDDSHWNDVDSQVAYNASASFLAYLLETYGPDRLKELFHVKSPDFVGRFAEIYGRPLEQAEAEWKRFCADWTG